jgi:hypothetical protein
VSKDVGLVDVLLSFYECGKCTGNPQITFFKVIYRRHTNFSMESIEQVFNGSADWGKKVTCTVSRNGDLIHKTYLQVVLPSVTVPIPNGASNQNGFRWVNWVGHALLKHVELEIGGQRIDKHWSTWIHIWNELSQSAGHSVGYANMVGNTSDLTGLTVASSGEPESERTCKGKTLYIPLQFWFCTSAGLALPLIALNIVGQKSIPPSVFERCARKIGFETQTSLLKRSSQMLVTCC